MVNSITYDENDIEKLKNKLYNSFADLFTEGLGNFTKDTFKLKIKENTDPIYKKPRLVPFALKEKLSNTINRLIKEKASTPIEASEWAKPIVPILKSDGSVRLCADYKVTINPHISIDRSPIPSVNEILSQMHGGEFYARIDLREAYAQIKIDENSKK